MPLTEVQQAQFDIIARNISPISYELADEQTRPMVLQAMQGKIEQIKVLYDAYPPEVQAAVRHELMPRLDFSWETGWEKCPHCHMGMISPDREEFTTKKDDNGDTIYKEQVQVLHDPEGNMMLKEDGNPMTQTVMVPDTRPIAIEKETCPHCSGTGERLIASVAA